MRGVKRGESIASRTAHIIYPNIISHRHDQGALKWQYLLLQETDAVSRAPPTALPSDAAHSHSSWVPKRSPLQNPGDPMFILVESWKTHVILSISLVVRSRFARFCHGQQLLSFFFIRCSLIQPWQVGLPANSHDTWIAISRADNSQLSRPTCEQSPRLRCDIGKIKCGHNRPNLPCIN